MVINHYKMLRETLHHLGLNEKEVKIYLALLTLGSARSSVVGKSTGIRRSTAHYTCQQLAKKGLLDMQQKGNTFVYIPEPPEKILFLLEDEKVKIKEKEDQAHRIIGSLKAMLNPASLLPKVRFYEGHEGVKKSYSNMLSECQEKEIKAIFSVVEDVGKDLQNFFVKEYVPGRVKRKIHMKNMALKSPKSIRYQKRDSLDLRETRFLPKEYFPAVNTEINFYGDYVHYMSFDREDSFAMIVKDKYIASVLTALFDLLWDKVAEK